MKWFLRCTKRYLPRREEVGQWEVAILAEHVRAADLRWGAQCLQSNCKFGCIPKKSNFTSTVQV
jgi:hypothetical protein